MLILWVLATRCQCESPSHAQEILTEKNTFTIKFPSQNIYIFPIFSVRILGVLATRCQSESPSQTQEILTSKAKIRHLIKSTKTMIHHYFGKLTKLVIVYFTTEKLWLFYYILWLILSDILLCDLWMKLTQLAGTTFLYKIVPSVNHNVSIKSTSNE